MQVVTSSKNDGFSTTSSSFQTVSDLSASITPSATTSKVLVHVTCVYSSNGNNGQITIFKGGSNFLNTLKDSGFGNRTSVVVQSANIGANQAAMMNAHYHVIDVANTTSAITYDVRVRGQGADFTINQNRNPDNVQERGCGLSTITLMEIGA